MSKQETLKKFEMERREISMSLYKTVLIMRVLISHKLSLSQKMEGRKRQEIPPHLSFGFLLLAPKFKFQMSQTNETEIPNSQI